MKVFATFSAAALAAGMMVSGSALAMDEMKDKPESAQMGDDSLTEDIEVGEEATGDEKKSDDAMKSKEKSDIEQKDVGGQADEEMKQDTELEGEPKPEEGGGTL